MTNRERWIIYPLLFMALGYGWKANVMPPEEVKCRRLYCDHAEFVTAEAHRFKGNKADFGAASAGQFALRDDEFTQLELLSTNRGGMMHIHRREPGPSPQAIHVIDQNNRKHMIGGLFRHPPKETPKAEPKKNEKPSGEEAAGK